MSARKRAAGTAASPELDTPDPVKKRKKNEVSKPTLISYGVHIFAGHIDQRDQDAPQV